MSIVHRRRWGSLRTALVAVACITGLACGSDTPTEPPPGGDPPGGDPPGGDPPAAMFVQVASGLAHTCALDDQGVVHCWGGNQAGQLGLGNTEGMDILEPTPIEADVEFVAVAAGDNHTCALDTTGAAHCWGADDFGQLGNGAEPEHDVPMPVAGGHVFTEIAAGASHTCGIVSQSEGYCWGDNSFGQLGSTTMSPSMSLDEPANIELELEGDQSVNLATIEAGAGHTCALDIDGAAFCWGNNGTGQLGDGTTDPSSIPVPVLGGATFDFVSITAGGVHSCAGAGGPASCWGFNFFGQLGDGTNDDTHEPEANSVVGDLDLVLLSGGSDHTCALTQGGAAYCWGLNGGGRLGDGSESDRNEPTAVSGGHAYVDISAGVTHTCGATTDGEVYCWGVNVEGQLGDGTVEDRIEPVLAGAP